MRATGRTWKLHKRAAGLPTRGLPPYQLNRPPCRYTAAVVVETRQVTHLGIGCRRVRQPRAKSRAHAAQLPSRFGWNAT